MSGKSPFAGRGRRRSLPIFLGEGLVSNSSASDDYDEMGAYFRNLLLYANLQ